MKNFSLILIATLLITSCSNSYDVSTNLDKSNFTDYFSPASVVIYKQVKDIPQSYKLLGLVEGEDCQLEAHHATPDEKIARTNARKSAYKLKANGIVFTGCAIVPPALPSVDADQKQCVSTLVCYGQAYQVNND